MFELCINAERHRPAGIEAETTLLDFLRQQLHLTGTKEGCASGDCGACTVVIGRLTNDVTGEHDPATLEYSTANSCITPLASLHGVQVLTVDALASDGGLHPVQAALVEHHGSQCGYCTPGFVMTLLGAALDAGGARVRQPAVDSGNLTSLAPLVAGNLCRCTGYRGILEATRQILSTPPAPIDALADAATRLAEVQAIPAPQMPTPRYHVPPNEAALRRMLRELDPASRLLSGGTDLWLEVTQQHKRFERIIDLSGVAELRAIRISDDGVSIGSAVTHARLLDLFGDQGALPSQAIAGMLWRFASPQIRRRATIGGNLANGSPIADWPPVLLALDAEAEIGHADGDHSLVPLLHFWLGYRRTALGPGDYLRAVRFGRLTDWRCLRVHKITKRHEDDISSVLLATRIVVDAERFTCVRVACGGVAATPVRLLGVEALLTGQQAGPTLDPALLAELDVLLERELTPISDVRASAAYRRAMVRALLERDLDAAIGRDVEPLWAVAAT